MNNNVDEVHLLKKEDIPGPIKQRGWSLYEGNYIMFFPRAVRFFYFFFNRSNMSGLLLNIHFSDHKKVIRGKSAGNNSFVRCEPFSVLKTFATTCGTSS
jgi:hypothetical protein